MELEYFELRNSDDGTRVTRITDVKQYLKDIVEHNQECDDPESKFEFLEDFPKDRWNGTRLCFDYSTTDMRENDIVLIRGEIVKPKPVKIETRYEV